jgi:hypothetical protein
VASIRWMHHITTYCSRLQRTKAMNWLCTALSCTTVDRSCETNCESIPDYCWRRNHCGVAWTDAGTRISVFLFPITLHHVSLKQLALCDDMSIRLDKEYVRIVLQLLISWKLQSVYEAPANLACQLIGRYVLI